MTNRIQRPLDAVTSEQPVAHPCGATNRTSPASRRPWVPSETASACQVAPSHHCQWAVSGTVEPHGAAESSTRWTDTVDPVTDSGTSRPTATMPQCPRSSTARRNGANSPEDRTVCRHPDHASTRVAATGVVVYDRVSWWYFAATGAVGIAGTASGVRTAMVANDDTCWR